MKKMLFLVLAVSGLVSACKKAKIDNETASSTDFARASQEFFQVLININEHAIAEKGLGRISSGGCLLDTLTGDTTHDSSGVFTNTGNLPTMKLVYSNCTGADGKTRNGTVQVSFTKKYTMAGCVATATLINYSVNGTTYQGTLTITRNSATSFIFSVADGSCTGGSAVIRYTASTTVSLNDNGTPSNGSDDFILVSGSANGTTHEGKTFSANIEDALKKRSDCSWISEGTASIKPDGLNTRKLDFGNGSCDDIASFTVDGQTYTVHLSK